ncbi:MAG: TonB-dependent receptor, partial [Acidobacteria bacterium]|nr:TonB-dependent receptor [Acidobacteriota bacterium]
MIIWKFLHTLILGWVITLSLEPSEHRGLVKLGGVPVPGVIVTATQNDKKFAVITDDQGTYVFPEMADGVWTIQVEMLGFAPVRKEVTIGPGAPAAEWELKILPLTEIAAVTVAASKPPDPPQQRPAAASPPPASIPPPSPDDNADLSQSAADGLLINGSVNNGAASPFAQSPAFGNARRTRAIYTGGIALTVDNSKLDARSYSLTGQDTPKPGYNHFIGGFSFGGPLRLPGLGRTPPNFFINYQRTRNRTANTQSALMPTQAERSGDFFSYSRPIIDPATGTPFPGNRIPSERLSPQARALLNYVPEPNFNGSRFNYQIPLLGATNQDNIQARLNKAINTRNQVFGDFALQRIAADSPNIFGFLDTSEILGINTNTAWTHRIGNRASITLRYQFSRTRTDITPNFANRVNVSGESGIAGNNQEPLNWGPPNLVFASGFAGLTDVQAASNRNTTHSFTFSGSMNRIGHTFQYGADFRRQQVNVLSQQDARGTFTFTGAATGLDFADFLLGIPTTSSIAFGNADKYFRQSTYAAYFSDDWRVRSGLTLNLGLRWEYESPMTEKYGRFVNLDIASGFTSATPVIGRGLSPDKAGIQPRVSLAWRPLPASSLVIRAGYGLYRNTSVYQPILTQMSQQAPLSKSFSVQNSAANPLTLANGLNVTGIANPNTFAVDPNFRIGYLQTWNVTAQRDLPVSLVMIAMYLGSRGSHLMQQILPNTYPAGAVNPCAACPTGFAYLMSNGTSRRDSAQIQLR